MQYVFSLYFSFDDDSIATFSFLVQGAALEKIGFSSPSFDAPGYCEHLDWTIEISQVMEEQFNSVHDSTGTHDDETMLNGFGLYETPDFQGAYEIAQRWREAFVEKLGEEGISEIVCFEGEEAKEMEEAAASEAFQIASRALAKGETCPAKHPSRLGL